MFEALVRKLNGQYDLSPMPVDRLLAYPGFDVKVRHFAYQIDRFPEYVRTYLWDEEWPGLVEELKRRKIDETAYNISKVYFEKCADEAELARSRINYGMQVAGQIGRKVQRVVGIRVIGAESRLDIRPPERGIRDLDLNVTVYESVDERDAKRINEIKRKAQDKTGIEVDIICPGMPSTAANMEHIMSLDYPLNCRGFPVFWREQRYLDFTLAKQNEFFENQIDGLKKFMQTFIDN